MKITYREEDEMRDVVIEGVSEREWVKDEAENKSACTAVVH